MQAVNRDGYDLNLLIVFDALARERSVTRAALKVRLSQPAMSHALSRLRTMLNDELFVRTPSGMQPTPRAEELILPLREALDGIRQAVEAQHFDPGRAARGFALALDNRAALVLAAPLVRAVSEVAPGVALRLRPSGTLGLAELLDSGELDLAVMGDPRRASGERFGSLALFEDPFVLVMRRGHPAATGPASLAWLAGLPFLEISSSGDDTRFLDAALAEAGLTRRTVLAAPYLSAPALLTGSDMVAIVSRRVAAEFARAHPVSVLDLPDPIAGTARAQAVMVWHRRSERLPSHRWLRSTVQRVAEQV